MCRNGCGRVRYSRDLCRRCFTASRDAGTLPPTLISNPREAGGRREDYAELRSWGLPIEAAARRVGVCQRTAERYEAALTAPARRAARTATVPAVPLLVVVDECQQLAQAGAIEHELVTALLRSLLDHGPAVRVAIALTPSRPDAREVPAP